MAIRPGNWCIVCTSNGHVRAVGRVFRTRPQTDHTESFSTNYRQSVVIDFSRNSADTELTSQATRLVWENFVQTTEALLIGDKPESITLLMMCRM